ncbi:MAG: PEP-CTERM sorting domain-containing protein [Verrucomicrobiota bacterium]
MRQKQKLILFLIILRRWLAKSRDYDKITEIMKNSNKSLLLTGAFSALLAVPSWGNFIESGSSETVLIDFEQGFTDLQEVGTIEASGVFVTFGTLNASGGAYIAEVGSNPRTGFAPDDQPYGGAGGNFFVTDESGTGLKEKGDFTIQFSEAVQNVTLDAYDYRDDGGANRGDTVSFDAYDEFNQLIGSDVYTITGKEVDGNVITFGVEAAGIRRVELVQTGGDVGAAIDNLSFEVFGVDVAAAPEPSDMAMLMLGGMGLFFWRRRA